MPNASAPTGIHEYLSVMSDSFFRSGLQDLQSELQLLPQLPAPLALRAGIQPLARGLCAMAW